MKQTIQFRSKIPTDDAWITKIAKKMWGAIEIISKKHIYNLLHIPSIIAVKDNQAIGFVMYAYNQEACEIVALYSALEKQGIGTALIEKVKVAAKQDGCTRIWLMTTNDNTDALRFYQKRGFVISAIHVNAIAAQRKLKPIPLLGDNGIPIRDEIELELRL